MNLYKISQTANDDYDTYDSAVVVAASVEEAQRMRPNDSTYGWADWTNVRVQYLGVADQSLVKGTICASFNAG